MAWDDISDLWWMKRTAPDPAQGGLIQGFAAGAAAGLARGDKLRQEDWLNKFKEKEFAFEREKHDWIRSEADKDWKFKTAQEEERRKSQGIQDQSRQLDLDRETKERDALERELPSWNKFNEDFRNAQQYNKPLPQIPPELTGKRLDEANKMLGQAAAKAGAADYALRVGAAAKAEAEERLALWQRGYIPNLTPTPDELRAGRLSAAKSQAARMAAEAGVRNPPPPIYLPTGMLDAGSYALLLKKSIPVAEPIIPPGSKVTQTYKLGDGSTVSVTTDPGATQDEKINKLAEQLMLKGDLPAAEARAKAQALYGAGAGAQDGAAAAHVLTAENMSEAKKKALEYANEVKSDTGAAPSDVTVQLKDGRRLVIPVLNKTQTEARASIDKTKEKLNTAFRDLKLLKETPPAPPSMTAQQRAAAFQYGAMPFVYTHGERLTRAGERIAELQEKLKRQEERARKTGTR